MNKPRKLISLSLIFGSLLLLATTPAFAATAVRVECQGNCSNVTLGTVCDSGTTATGRAPLSVSCDDNSTAVGTACGRAECVRFTLSRNNFLSTYCVDGTGADAIVTCDN